MTSLCQPGVTVAAAIISPVIVAVVGGSATHSPASSPTAPSATGTSAPSSTATTSTSAPAATSAAKGQCGPFSADPGRASSEHSRDYG